MTNPYIEIPRAELKRMTRNALISIILGKQSELTDLSARYADIENQYAELQNNYQELLTKSQAYKVEIGKLQLDLTEKTEQLNKQTQEKLGNEVNQPSSKQPEFNKDTGKEKKPKKKRRRGKGSGMPGAGNKSKPEPDIIINNPLNVCPECNCDLSDCPVSSTTSRIVEDIPPIPEETIISKEIQERKICHNCNKLVSSVSEAALPGSDIGIRTVGLVVYFWVVASLSLPSIVAYLKTFFRLNLSTAGISKMVIRVAKIMTPVADEILEDVKNKPVIFADETGWRVKGVLWWLWAFANKRSAYYWADPKRSSAVVAKILGTVFSGVLVTDAWAAYNKVICKRQTCMAHILRKIRKFRDMYPEYYEIVDFYKKLKRILDDGEKLKQNRITLGEIEFQRKLKLLKARLTKLLQWKDPNKVLQEVIAKVERQSEHILTFVEYDDVPNHNNYAEYIIKKGILKRKVSGGSMSADGVQAYATLQSIAQTCHLRNISFVSFFAKSMLCYIRTGKPMLLSTYESTMTETIKEEKVAA